MFFALEQNNIFPQYGRELLYQQESTLSVYSAKAH